MTRARRYRLPTLALPVAAALLSVVGAAAAQPQPPAAAPAAAPASAASPVPLPMRLTDAVRPLAVSLALTIDPQQPRHSGEVAIEVRLDRPAATVRLHARELQIDSAAAEVDGRRSVATVQPVDEGRIALVFDPPLPAGRARLRLGFRGALQDKAVYGLFRQRDDGRWQAFTHFQPAGARQAFPLFDEPGWKLPWTVELTVPEALTAVSNMPLARQTAVRPGWKTLHFEPTPPLPSYLLAFAVGDFDLRAAAPAGKVPVRFVTPHGRAAEADFAAANTGRIVERLERYFGMPYPFAKLDSLALPATSNFSAMEHPGMITYTSTLMLARPGEATPRFQRDYVATAAHELAHQWFGNLVTPAWWDDLWLNESFASWMGDRITAELMPAWGWHTSVQRARASAMRADRLVSARRIEQPVDRNDDLGNLFDEITYDKGQVVIAMAENWLGAERFRDGVRRYIGRHANGNASSADFFAALAESDATVPDMLRSFTRQAGVPLLRVALHCDGGAPPRLELQQSRLLPLGSSGVAGPAQRWQLPLLLRTPAGPARLLMRDAQATLRLPGTGCPAWVQANAGGAGYYRVAYDGTLLAALAAAPASDVNELLALLDDARGLHEAGAVDSRQTLALVDAFANQPRREVAEAAIELLRQLRPLVQSAQAAAYARRWQAAFGARGRALGWRPGPNDSDDDLLLRVRLLPLLADLGADAGLRAQARSLAEAWLLDRPSLDAGMRRAVLATAAIDGDTALFETLVAALRASNHRPEREDLLAALGNFRQPALAERARRLLLDPAIDIRDGLWPLLGTQGTEPALRADALRFVDRQHAALAGRMGRDDPASLPTLFASGCSADEQRQIDQAFARHAARYPGGRVALARTLEAVQLCTAWRARQASGL